MPIYKNRACRNTFLFSHFWYQLWYSTRDHHGYQIHITHTVLQVMLLLQSFDNLTSWSIKTTDRCTTWLMLWSATLWNGRIWSIVLKIWWQHLHPILTVHKIFPNYFKAWVNHYETCASCPLLWPSGQVYWGASFRSDNYTIKWQRKCCYSYGIMWPISVPPQYVNLPSQNNVIRIQLGLNLIKVASL